MQSCSFRLLNHNLPSLFESSSNSLHRPSLINYLIWYHTVDQVLIWQIYNVGPNLLAINLNESEK